MLWSIKLKQIKFLHNKKSIKRHETKLNKRVAYDENQLDKKLQKAMFN